MEQIQQAQPLTNSREPKAEGLEELQPTFLQNVSHELRTPLSVILGYAELLHDGELGTLAEKQQEAVFTIVNQTHGLRTLVERIGILLEVEANAYTLAPLVLDDIISAAVEERGADATQAGLVLEVHLEPDLPLVAGDPYLLQHAMDCLLDNALKFTSSGGQVTVQGFTEPGWVCLAVTGIGTGIAEEKLERIFTRFYQVDGSTTRPYGGMGLGLNVAKAIVEEFGGRIEVQGKPGQGSRFMIKLPALSPDTQMALPIEEEGILRHILVVDDEENVVLTLRDALETLPNCEIAIATDGKEALRLLEQQPTDLLITDYKMPGTDGLTLAAHVRELYPRIAVIMITAYSSDEIREQAAGLSIRRVLNKPVQIVEIRGVALEALEGSESS